MADNWQLKAVSPSTRCRRCSSRWGTSQRPRGSTFDVAGAANHLTGKIGLLLTARPGVLGGFSGRHQERRGRLHRHGRGNLQGQPAHRHVGAEQLQRMKYVSEQAGVPVESLQMGMAKLNKQMGDASAGKNKDLALLMKKLGISARDANGQLKAGIDIPPQLADAFVRNKNPVVQARMGMALFGKSWQEMVPLLMEGSEGINPALSASNASRA